ncbi:MAG: AraC family transcriptional regulator N-terminal domain-containing protein [Bacillota bacterium]
MDYNRTIKNLFFMRDSNATGPSHGVYKPSLFMVVQGAKEDIILYCCIQDFIKADWRGSNGKYG